jgi:hypothetical protein
MPDGFEDRWAAGAWMLRGAAYYNLAAWQGSGMLAGWRRRRRPRDAVAVSIPRPVPRLDPPIQDDDRPAG